jgi:hypothetical protein
MKKDSTTIRSRATYERPGSRDPGVGRLAATVQAVPADRLPRQQAHAHTRVAGRKRHGLKKGSASATHIASGVEAPTSSRRFKQEEFHGSVNQPDPLYHDRVPGFSTKMMWQDRQEEDRWS